MADRRNAARGRRCGVGLVRADRFAISSHSIHLMELSDDKRIDLLLAPVHEMASFYKLLLGLSTGAVVVFVNLLNGIHVRMWITSLLILAIVCFGVAAALCLRLMMHLVEVHSLVAESAQKQIVEPQNLEAVQLLVLLNKFEKMADALGLIFVAGVALSAIFVIALWIVRASI